MVAENKSDWIVDLVGNAGGKLADDGQLFRLQQLCLVLAQLPVRLCELVATSLEVVPRPLPLGNVLHCTLVVQDLTFVVGDGPRGLPDPANRAILAAQFGFEHCHRPILLDLLYELSPPIWMDVELAANV